MFVADLSFDAVVLSSIKGKLTIIRQWVRDYMDYRKNVTSKELPKQQSNKRVLTCAKHSSDIFPLTCLPPFFNTVWESEFFK